MSGEDLVFVGDAHLERDDPSLPEFLRFLDGVGRTAARIVFMGDLFNLWLGRRELELTHQTAVLDKLMELRRRGLVVRYLEGNRDYRIGPCYGGHALDDATSQGLTERFGGLRLFAIHGDLANAADRQYRIWRRVTRSAPIWWLFNRLPRDWRLRLAESLETRLRSTNVGFRGAFPEKAVKAYAASFLGAGHDIVVLGHFHVEKDLELGGKGRILVLPEWKSTRRFLRVRPQGLVEFVKWEAG